MGQFVEEEQYLFQIAADFLKQRTELEKLREAVRLAEAAKALRLEELQRRRGQSEGRRSVCRISTAHPASAVASRNQVSDG